MSATPSPAMPNADETQRVFLRQVKTTFEKAAHENNLEPMRPHLDPAFSIVTYTDREFIDFDKFKTQWNQTRAELLKGGSYEVELLPEPSMILGDVALSHGESKNVMVTGAGKRFEFGSHWTVVWRKTEGQWKILRAHSSLSPFTNPMLKAGVKKIVVRAVVIALVVGVAIGLLAGWLITKG